MIQPPRSIQHESRFDVVLCGLVTADLIVHPVAWDRAFDQDILREIGSVVLSTGGIVANSGLALAKLGQRAAALTVVGDDEWGRIVRNRLDRAGIDSTHVVTIDGLGTSTTVVLVDHLGERRFLHHAGAPQEMTDQFFFDRLDVFRQSSFALFGYYSLFPRLEPALPEVFREIRRCGCKVVLDAAGSGGSMELLRRILPHVDVYFPSFHEARQQTGSTDVEVQMDQFRKCGATGLVGIKLGADGVALHDGSRSVRIPAHTPPKHVVDTTGAGDCFLAGFLTGLNRQLNPVEAARLGTIVAAHAITQHGADAGITDLDSMLVLLNSEGN